MAYDSRDTPLLVASVFATRCSSLVFTRLARGRQFYLGIRFATARVHDREREGGGKLERVHALSIKRYSLDGVRMGEERTSERRSSWRIIGCRKKRKGIGGQKDAGDEATTKRKRKRTARGKNAGGRKRG